MTDDSPSSPALDEKKSPIDSNLACEFFLKGCCFDPLKSVPGHIATPCFSCTSLPEEEPEEEAAEEEVGEVYGEEETAAEAPTEEQAEQK